MGSCVWPNVWRRGSHDQQFPFRARDFASGELRSLTQALSQQPFPCQRRSSISLAAG